MFGGKDKSEYYNDMYCYNVRSKSFTQVHPQANKLEKGGDQADGFAIPSRSPGADYKGPSARCGHGAVAINGYMFIFGGRTRRTFLNDLHRYDAASRTWEQVCATLRLAPLFGDSLYSDQSNGTPLPARSPHVVRKQRRKIVSLRWMARSSFRYRKYLAERCMGP